MGTPEEARPAGGYADFATQDVAEVFRALDTAPDGLTSAAAAGRLAVAGPNVIDGKKRGAVDILRRQLESPMVGLLAFAGVVAFALGERLDAIVIFAILLIDAGIGFFQEYRSEKALEALATHLDPRARVRRGGAVQVVLRSALVPGDIVVLRPGDIAPADLRVVSSQNLLVDEAVLTGESVHVSKTEAVQPTRPSQPYQASNAVFMMTRVVSGSAEAAVVATAKGTVIGGIARLTEETVHVSAFQRNIEKLSRFLLKTVALILAVVFCANVFLKGADQLVPQLLFAIAMAVSVIPEALPAITAITLSKGAMRLARKHVIVKRLTSIEDLGHIQVLCTDKTGTLTQGVLALREIEAADRERTHVLAMAACGEEELQDVESPKTFGGALMAAADERIASRYADVRRFWFGPFDPTRRRTSAVIEVGGERLLVVLGAAEEVLTRCSLPEAPRRDLERRIAQEGLKGRRILVLASRTAAGPVGTVAEEGLTYLGHLAFVDPLKPTALAAVQDAERLDVRVMILTGDAPEVAGAIAREVGILAGSGGVTTGAELEAMDHAEFHKAVETREVFARVSPEQKYRIIEELQRTKQVGFLGEGINDAPALKLANVSLVVEGASDVAREAADILLLRKDLHVIVEGIREGRVIFSNIVKYVKYTLIGNMGNFLAIAGISLIVDYLPMLPVQILLTNLLTDLPLIAVADDRVDDAELEKPKVFDIRELALAAVFLGLVSSTFDFIFFAMFRQQGAAGVQTYWFIFSILTELALIYSIRTRGPFWRGSRPGSWLLVLTAMAAAFTLTIPFSSYGAAIFHFVRVDAKSLAVVFGLALLYFTVTEIVKRSHMHLFKTNGSSHKAV